MIEFILYSLSIVSLVIGILNLLFDFKVFYEEENRKELSLMFFAIGLIGLILMSI